MLFLSPVRWKGGVVTFAYFAVESTLIGGLLSWVRLDEGDGFFGEALA